MHWNLESGSFKMTIDRLTKTMIFLVACTWCTSSLAQINPDVFVREFGRMLNGLPNQLPVPGSLPLSLRPTIDCSAIRSANPVALVLCSGAEGAAADWDLNAALWSTAGALSTTQQKTFDAEQEGWRGWLNARCRLALVGYISDQQRLCVINEFHSRAAALRARLSGDALVESQLSPERHAVIQDALIKRSLLAPPSDGEFGPNTRQAIRMFQASDGGEQTGYLTLSQSARLLAVDTAALPAGSSGKTLLTDQEAALLMARLRQFWVFPATLDDSSDRPVVQIRLRLGPDKVLAGPPQIISSGSSPRYFATVNAALEAIRRAQPFDMLMTENYMAWRDMTLTFDPQVLAAPLTKQVEALPALKNETPTLKSETSPEPKTVVKPETRQDTNPPRTPDGRGLESKPQPSKESSARAFETTVPQSTDIRKKNEDGIILFVVGLVFFSLRGGYCARKAESSPKLGSFDLSTGDRILLLEYESSLKKAVRRMVAIFAEARRDDLKVNLDGSFHRGSKKGHKFNIELESLVPEISALKENVGNLGTAPLRALRVWSAARSSLFSSISLLLMLLLWPLVVLPLSVASLIGFAIAAAIVEKGFRLFLPSILENKQPGIDEFRYKWSKYENIDSWVDEQHDDSDFYGGEDADVHDDFQRDDQKERSQNEENPNQKERLRSWMDILGVPMNASLQEIKTAYHKKVKEFHSDRLRGIDGLSPEIREFADRKLAEVNAAYEEATAKFKTH
jgi:peptidoglycan hydrolase-like protein with peptidoglycan-binding domain/uncharacterized protein YecT (DUF1311 family)